MVSKKNLIENYDDGNLDLSLSGIVDVPVKDIAAIPKAIYLDLSCNTIVSLPKSFATSLTRLVKLDLSKNQISSLPDNFGLLVNLKHLDLYNNKLVSLPLSFGNLNSLRWLDLKNNPLMPKLAQIAGQCLDAHQCQAAARNVVAAYKSTQDQVNAEITRRKEKQIQEEVEEQAKIQKKESNQSKKKKKKKAAAEASSANGQSHFVSEEDSASIPKTQNTHDTPSVPTKKNAQKPTFLNKVGRLLSLLLKCVVMSALLVALSAFLLSLIDENLYLSVKRSVREAVQANVPKHIVKRWDDSLLVAQKAVKNWVTQVVAVGLHWYNRTHDYLTHDEVVQQYLESIKSGWHILWIRLTEAYETLAQLIPRYLDSIKGTVVESSPNKL